MTEIVDKVAKAIGAVSTSGAGRTDEQLLEACARAAIEALREPSKEMLSAMWGHVTLSLTAGQQHQMTALWEAAIDAALEGR